MIFSDLFFFFSECSHSLQKVLQERTSKKCGSQSVYNYTLSSSITTHVILSPRVQFFHLQDVLRYCIACYCRSMQRAQTSWRQEVWDGLVESAREVCTSMALQQLVEGKSE